MQTETIRKLCAGQVEAVISANGIITAAADWGINWPIIRIYIYIPTVISELSEIDISTEIDITKIYPAANVEASTTTGWA